MANRIRFRRSYEQGVRPSTSDVSDGELALNAHINDPALFMQVDDTDEKGNREGKPKVIKIGPTLVSGTKPKVASKGESWLEVPEPADKNQRFPTLKVHDGSDFVDAIRMVIPELKPEPETIETRFFMTSEFSGKHIHITDKTDYLSIDFPYVDRETGEIMEDVFTPGEAFTIYNGRSEDGLQLLLRPQASTVHFAGNPPNTGQGVNYVLQSGALVTLLCVNRENGRGQKFGTFVLSGAGIA